MTIGFHVKTFPNILVCRRNLDPLTETYGLAFYLQYLSHWPEYFQVAEAPNGDLMGYIMGKSEGHGENWHGHVTALSVSMDYRRLGLAATLMAGLEAVSEKYSTSPHLLVSLVILAWLLKWAYFVDLFVRVSNKVAVDMYTRLGYCVYRRVLEYYSGDPDEDAFDSHVNYGSVAVLATLNFLIYIFLPLAELTAIGRVPRWQIGERPSDMKASCETSRITDE
ncbi:NAA20 [Cordylochernes scorpioides]|uniref:N-alpha-acetyltransferase 20 n=1 Tax=Cordylochernes scorpioides TaxID=51811 RepID=A0ABY6L574_9ARAC|nr:NAA20 [Cordylochernes scorpioides]